MNAPQVPVDRVRAGDDKYRAPEVNEDSFQPDPKNDVFSLGMTLLEMAGDFYLPNGGLQWLQLRKNNFPSSQLKESTYVVFYIVSIACKRPYCYLLQKYRKS